MSNQKKLLDFSTGDKFTLFLLVTKIEVRKSQRGTDFLNVELRDKETSVQAKFWSGFESFYSSMKEGGVAKIAGKMDEYNGARQVIIEKARAAEDSDGFSIEDFLPGSERDLNVMIDELNEFISSIKNSYLKKLLDMMLSGNSYEKYIRVPAGKAWHHAYINGLLEHTLEIIKICDLMCSFHPEVNRDLLLTGAILHDYGKVEELKTDNGFDYTDKGKLMGHIVICSNLINDKASKIEGFPQDLLEHIHHLVLSHQGKLEHASPVIPKTLEAIILYHADELSAKTNAYKQAVSLARQENPDSLWTKYLPLAETQVYVPKIEKIQDEIKDTLF